MLSMDTLPSPTTASTTPDPGVEALRDALRDSEQRFSYGFDGAPIGMTLTAPDGAYLRVNPAFCRLLGRTEQELLHTDIVAVTHPDDRAETARALDAMARGELHSFQAEKSYLHSSGERVWVLLSSAVVRDAEGMPLYLFSQVQDITERRRAEAS